MQILIPATAKTVIVEATMGDDGSLHVDESTPLTLAPGARVMLTISPIAEARSITTNSLAGSVTFYNDPFGPATSLDDWESLTDC